MCCVCVCGVCVCVCVFIYLTSLCVSFRTRCRFTGPVSMQIDILSSWARPCSRSSIVSGSAVTLSLSLLQTQRHFTPMLCVLVPQLWEERPPERRGVPWMQPSRRLKSSCPHRRTRRGRRRKRRAWTTWMETVRFWTCTSSLFRGDFISLVIDEMLFATVYSSSNQPDLLPTSVVSFESGPEPDEDPANRLCMCSVQSTSKTSSLDVIKLSENFSSTKTYRDKDVQRE